MGIPHLITFLRPFSVREALRGQSIIIDGPGLCYHVYHVSLGLRPNAPNYFEAVPSYQEIGEALLAYLKGLEKSDAVM